MSGESAPRHARASLLLDASRHRLAKQCAAALAACGPAADGRLALLVSGGGDSVALLLLMSAIRERGDSALDSLAVLTVDHGLRREAVDECASALELASRLGIARAECVRVEVDADGNTLDRARAARLLAARAFAERHGCVAAVTAHTADDRAESLLMGLRRGAGLAAAARLRAVRTFEDGSSPTVLRPLLGARRAELRAFLGELGVAWHDDPSNALHERGALRGDPLRAGILDEIARGATRLADEASELVAFRDEEVERRLGRGRTSVPRAEFDALPGALRAAALIAMLRAGGGEASSETIDRAVDALARGERAPLRFGCCGALEVSIDARTVEVRTVEVRSLR